MGMKHILIFVTLFLVGCSHTQQYPDSWSKIEKSINGKCPDISGRYENIATDIDGKNAVGLSWLIFSNEEYIEGVEYVEFFLEPTHTTLQVSARSSKGTSISSTFLQSEKGFYCKNGSLIIEDNEFFYTYGVVAREWRTFVFNKTDDGLVMQYINSGAGLVFLLPVAATNKSWYLYKNKPNNSSNRAP